ncbi:Aminopeptidase YpdF [subsurface metagenome]
MTRIKKILDRLAGKNCNAILITNRENITYLSNFTGDSSHLVVSDNGCMLITDGRYTEQAKIECDANIQIFKWIDNNRYGVETYNYAIDKLKITRLGFESTILAYSDFIKLSKGLKKTRLIPVSGITEELRQIKEKSEIANLRKACRISDKALELTLPGIKPGMTEIEITALLEYKLKTNGADDISFASIVLSGKKTSLLHGKPDDTKVEHGDFLLFDFGALFKGYHADISRTIVVGKASGKQRKLFNIVQSAQEKAVDCIKEGIKGNKPDAIVRNIIPDEFIDYYYPGLGHGVGLEIHELPFIKKEADFVFRKGMIVTIEPGIYIPGWGGLRIEDTVLVRDNSCESLSQFPRNLIEIS